MNRRIRAVAVCALVAILAVAGWIFFRAKEEIRGPARADHRVVGTDDEGNLGAGGATAEGRQKAADPQPHRARKSSRPKPKPLGPLDYGTLPAIKPDANPQVKAVVEAIKQKNHPERLSVMAPPPAFDAKAYKADPAAYLSMVEMGRVFQTAQPGPGVPQLRAASPNFNMLTQGESVWLKVSAPPGAPVSFTSFDCGQFDNLLTAITVKANEDGVAEAKFTTTPGTINDIHVLAGSPQTSGQVRFVVNVAMSLANTKQPGPQRGRP